MNQNRLTKRELLGWVMLACVPVGLVSVMVNAFGWLEGLGAFAAACGATWFVSKAIRLTEGG